MRGPRRPKKVGEDLLLAGRIHGLRAWQLVPGPEGELRLAGLNGKIWERGRPTRAECQYEPITHVHAPADGCTCGLHGVHPWAHDELPWQGSGPQVTGI